MQTFAAYNIFSNKLYERKLLIFQMNVNEDIDLLKLGDYGILLCFPLITAIKQQKFWKNIFRHLYQSARKKNI